jgi:hypothetical protein
MGTSQVEEEEEEEDTRHVNSLTAWTRINAEAISGLA